MPNTALPPKTVALKSDWASSLPQTNADGTSALPANSSAQTAPGNGGAYELIFRPDPSIFDGRFANNGWLQELPKPLTKLTWDNVALVSPNTAQRLGLSYQNYDKDKKGGEVFVDQIELTLNGRTIGKPLPAWIMPGQP